MTVIGNENVCLIINICKLTIISNFHPLEVVGHDSKTQLNVREHLNYLAQRFK